jgi:hypothetical protein
VSEREGERTLEAGEVSAPWKQVSV